MAKINTIIAESNFEKIRDRIGLILTDEIANQYTLTSDNIYLTNVFIERDTPLNISEYPSINIRYISNNDGISSAKSDQVFVNNYFIEVFTTNMISLQKLMGTIRAILMDTQYITLGFDKPSIQNRTVRSLQVTDVQNNQDTETVQMGRVTFDVKCNEEVTLTSPVDLFSSYTQVKLGDTTKGFYYTFIKE